MSHFARRTSRKLSPEANHYASVHRRTNNEELPSDNASPSLALADWPYLLVDRLEDHASGADDTKSHSHLPTTSFATLDFREKREVSGTPYPRPHAVSSASADDARGAAPAYARDGKEMPNGGHEEDEELYIDDERVEIEEEKTALLWESAALLYYKVERDGGHDSVSLNAAQCEPEKKRSSADYWSRTIKLFFAKGFGPSGGKPARAAVDDTYLQSSRANGPSSATEKVKAPPASMFNMRVDPMRVPMNKPTRAPSVRSSKQRAASKDSPQRVPDTAALTSSARAIEGRMRPMSSASFEYTEGMRPMSQSWELPEGMQSPSGVLYEALYIARRQREGDWKYTPANEGGNGAGPSSGYVQVTRRHYY